MTGSTNLTAARPTDLVLSADGSRAYAAGADGKLRVYDLATRTLIQTIDVGISLAGMDISPDGSFILVAERQPNGVWGADNVFRSTSILYRVDLASGAVTSFSVQDSGSNNNFYDVAILANGQAVVTQEAYSAHLPIWTLNLATGQFTASAERFSVRSTLEASLDRSHVLIAQGDSSSAALFVYEGGTGIVHRNNSNKDGVQGYNIGVFAFSEEANLVAQNASGKLYIYDAALNYKLELSALHPGYYLGHNIGGLVFDATGANLYILMDSGDEITQISTSDWRIVRSFDVGADVGDPQLGGFGNRLAISPDGKTFIVSTTSGVQLIANDPSTSGRGGPGLTTGGPGDDRLTGGPEGDTLTGDAGADRLDGLTGSDLIYSHLPLPADNFYGYPYQARSGDIYADRDMLDGGEGSDYLFAGYGDTVVGGNNDGSGDRLYISFQGATSGVVADFRALVWGGSMAVGGATLSGIEIVVSIEGSEYGDVLTGFGDAYASGPPGEWIYGRGGDDHIVAGDLSGLGDSFISGGDGDDLIDLSRAVYLPEAYGDAGNDRIVGGGSSDTIYGGEGNDRLEGNSGFDALFGGSGNDILDGAGFGDRLLGDEGDDILYGGGDEDLMYGGAGNDLLRGDSSLTGHGNELTPSSNADRMFGEAGNDDLFGEEGADTLDGGDDQDRLYGGEGDDVLRGGSGDDFLVGNRGNDDLDGGEGADTARFYVFAGGVAVNLHAGASFVYSDGDQVRTLAAGRAVDSDGFVDSLTGIENVVTTEFADFVQGSDGANRIESGEGHDQIAALGGNDTIFAGTGADLVVGGEGDDDIFGEAGNDSLHGSAGNDTIDAGAGGDSLYGGAGNDILTGGAGEDLMRGDDGDDVLNGGDDSDLMRGGSGVDTFDGGGEGGGTGPAGPFGDRISFAEAGATQGVVADLRTGIISNDGFGNRETMANIESLGADSAFVDTLYGNDAVNSLLVGRGDFAYGFGGDDMIMLSLAAALADGGAGVDRLELRSDGNYLSPDSDGDGLAEGSGPVGTGWTVDLAAGSIIDGLGNVGTVAGIENVLGGVLNDTIQGDDEANRLAGAAGDDRLGGGGGSDILEGGEGNDVLRGGAGIDRFDGGTGIDTIDFSGDAGPYGVIVNLSIATGISSGARPDQTRPVAGGESFDGSATYESLTDIENAIGTGFDDVLYGNSWANRFEGGGGDDVLMGEWGDDVLLGGEGGDTLYGSDGRDSLDGDGGDDALWGGAGDDRLSGGAGDDILGGGTGRNELAGGQGNDLYVVGSLVDTIVELVGEGSDELRTDLGSFSIAALASIETLTGTNNDGQTLTGNDLGNVINGANGNDLLIGGQGDDIIYGNGGDDVIIGFAGADVLRGGAGNDVYAIDAADIIIEFAGDGYDEVRTVAEIFVLADTLENLRATSDIGHDFRGNAGNNVIIGGNGNDMIRLADGGDDMAFGKDGIDSFYFGAAFGANDKVDGGGNRDSLLLQGDYSAGITFLWAVAGGSSLVDVEGISLVSGSNAFFGDTANNRYSYNLTLVDSNVAAGALMKVNGFNLLAGENVTIDASAETDAALQILAGLGTDTLTGGAMGDAFVFGHNGRFGAGDSVDGGGGYDVVYLRGDYAVDFNAAGFAGAFTGVESIALLTSTNNEFVSGGDGEFDYNIVWNDAMLATGGTFTVNGSRLGAAESFTFDGSAETNGTLRIFGGAAADSLTGGGGNDQITGGGGADVLVGGAGADLFRFAATSDSTSGAFDTVQDFVAGTDKIDVQRVDAKASTATDNEAFAFIGAAAFSASGANAPGELRAFNVSGNLWQVEGDVNGDGVADLVIQVHVEAGQPLTAGDFVV